MAERALPGLIDAHHRSQRHRPIARIRADCATPRSGAPARGPALVHPGDAARAFLRSGITTVRDVGSPDDEAITLREAIRLGLIPGPRILSCGRILSTTSPGARIFGTMYEEADGPWEMRRAVRRQLRRGADFIKVMATGARSVERENPEPAQMTAEEIGAAVDEAHRLGLRVAAHAEGLDGARLAIGAGVDTIEHGLSLHREPALLDRMAEQGIVLVPTLSTFHDLAERFRDDFAPSLVAQAERQREEAAKTLVAARAAGVTLAMGYDSGPPGANAQELVRLVEAGLPATEAIVAATSGSALALGLTDRGTVVAGQAADLLVVDGDPLAEPAVIADPARIWLVARDGVLIAPRGPTRTGAPARR